MDYLQSLSDAFPFALPDGITLPDGPSSTTMTPEQIARFKATFPYGWPDGGTVDQSSAAQAASTSGSGLAPSPKKPKRKSLPAPIPPPTGSPPPTSTSGDLWPRVLIGGVAIGGLALLAWHVAEGNKKRR